MSFSIGIVGLPNVGKSTLFQALTHKQVDTSNYPFCTIDPNVGVVSVPDSRLDELAKLLKPDKVIPTTIEFFDIAGLVKGAHKGEGLGNKFLAHIRQVEAIGHLIRNFESANVTHVSGAINPISDATVVNLELIMADLSLVEKRLAEFKPKAQSGDSAARHQVVVLDKLMEAFQKAQFARSAKLTPEELELINDLNLLTLKPMLYIINQDEEKPTGYSLKGLEPRVTLSAKLECDLADLPSEEQKKYREELKIEAGGLERLIHSAYQLLNLITFFTTQSRILQAWTVSQNTEAAIAAGRIHTDFQENFIRAEVVNWKDLIGAGSETTARHQGLIRVEGRKYIVQDGDVIQIRAKS